MWYPAAVCENIFKSVIFTVLMIEKNMRRIFPPFFSVLVGEGARIWAKQHGIKVDEDNQLITGNLLICWAHDMS